MKLFVILSDMMIPHSFEILRGALTLTLSNSLSTLDKLFTTILFGVDGFFVAYRFYNTCSDDVVVQ
jgi:hypothetical protein